MDNKGIIARYYEYFHPFGSCIRKLNSNLTNENRPGKSFRGGVRPSKNYAFRLNDRAAGECEGAKSPPRIKLTPRKWIISAIFSILRNSKCDGSDCQKSPRDFFDNLKTAPEKVSGAGSGGMVLRSRRCPRCGDAAPRRGYWKRPCSTSPCAQSPDRSRRGGRSRNGAGHSTTSNPRGSCPVL